jgi:hypothetical protein
MQKGSEGETTGTQLRVIRPVSIEVRWRHVAPPGAV